jgi:chaperonin GroEL
LKAQCTNIDQRIGIEIIEKALRAPATIIVNNAGLEGAVVVGELLKKTTPQEGFNAADCTYVDLIGAGIIDPTKVCDMHISPEQLHHSGVLSACYVH